MSAIEWSPDGRLLGVARDDGAIFFLDSETGTLLHSLRLSSVLFDRCADAISIQLMRWISSGMSMHTVDDDEDAIALVSFNRLST